ncbi:hypothetical protein [Desulfovibrio sp.]|uniref:hypothetical protein n=1 Tax=Desulfovibrio sp. TaxID=885 RepID=UPI003079CBB8
MPAPENVVEVYLIFNHRGRSGAARQKTLGEGCHSRKNKTRGARPGQNIFMEM